MVSAIGENVTHRIPLIEVIDRHGIHWNTHLVFHPCNQLQECR